MNTYKAHDQQPLPRRQENGQREPETVNNKCGGRMSVLISASEMAELTGAKTATKQCQVLQRSGIRYTTRADGRPALTWEAYNRQLAAPINDTSTASGPRLESI